MFYALSQSVALLLSLFFFIAGNGFLTTFITVRLHNDSVNTWLVGAVSAAFFIGLVSGSFQLGKFIRRVGHIRAFAVFASVFSIVTLLQGLFVYPTLWIGLRLISGFTTAGIYIVIESWLLAASTFEDRGKILAIYMIVFYAGQTLGQFFLNITELHTLTPFVIIAMLASLSVIPLSMTRASSPSIEGNSLLNIKKLYQLSPSGITGGVASGVISGATYGLMPLYLSKVFNSSDYISVFMAVLIVGGMALQYPIGRLSDKLDRRDVLIAVSFATLLCSVAVIFLTPVMLLLMLLLFFLFGGLSFTLYPLCISNVCDYADPEDIIPVTQGMLLAYSIGAAIGPLIAPGFIQYWGANGLFIYYCSISGLLSLFFLWRRFQRAPVPEEEQQPYVTLPRTTPVISEFDPRVEEDVETNANND